MAWTNKRDDVGKCRIERSEAQPLPDIIGGIEFADDGHSGTMADQFACGGELPNFNVGEKFGLIFPKSTFQLLKEHAVLACVDDGFAVEVPRPYLFEPFQVVALGEYAHGAYVNVGSFDRRMPEKPVRDSKVILLGDHPLEDSFRSVRLDRH